MLRTLRGFLEIEIAGAEPELALNRLTGKDIPFWSLRRTDAFHFECRIYQAHWEAAKREITACLCTVKVLRTFGLPHAVRGLRKRPLLIAGMILAFLLSYISQYWVWFVRVEGAEEIPRDQILRTISEEGVRFGVWGPALDTQYLKNRMLNRIPELRWLAVNREGGIAHVLVSERDPKLSGLDMDLVTNVIASTDGIITGISVLNGFPAVQIGDAVTKGQLLVSGTQEWTNRIQATRAIAEVEALTLHRIRLNMPSMALKKVYTGREAVCKTLIFKRFRIKISGNSSIFGIKCDKMIKTVPLTLPGGFELPISLEIVALREYSLVPMEIEADEAEAVLQTTAKASVQRDLIAGTVESEEIKTQRTEALYCCEASLNCRELISRTVAAPLFGEDVEYGQNHQRGAD